MKTTGYLIIAPIVIGLCFAGCSNSEQVKKLATLANRDSALLVKSYQKDSTITSYLGEMSQIQNNLERIKAREKIITLATGEINSSKEYVLTLVKELDQWIVANDKEMNSLEGQLRKMTSKNDNLANIVTHLSQEIAIKDTEIAIMQTKLGKANDSLNIVTASFKDSIEVINIERAQEVELTAEMNTVYYAIGTIKFLKSNGIINKEGGFIGIGRTARVNPEFDNSKFTQADLTNMKVINLNGKFRNLITTHPVNSYSISSDDKSDYITITNRLSFWGKSKYMVVVLK